jgi:hypothetical protein
VYYTFFKDQLGIISESREDKKLTAAFLTQPLASDSVMLYQDLNAYTNIKYI